MVKEVMIIHSIECTEPGREGDSERSEESPVTSR